MSFMKAHLLRMFRTTPKGESLGMTTVFNASGVDKKEFVKYTENQPATYEDWSRTWQQETTGYFFITFIINS